MRRRSAPASPDAEASRTRRCSGAIKTDFILSAEIMAITLATRAGGSFWMQAFVLAVVGIGITVAGLWRRGADREGGRCRRGAGRERPAGLGPAAPSGAAFRGRPGRRAADEGLGRARHGHAVFLKALGIVGTAAMMWVGGGIIVHGLEEYGLAAPRPRDPRSRRRGRPCGAGARRRSWNGWSRRPPPASSASCWARRLIPLVQLCRRARAPAPEGLRPEGGGTSLSRACNSSHPGGFVPYSFHGQITQEAQAFHREGIQTRAQAAGPLSGQISSTRQ